MPHLPHTKLICTIGPASSSLHAIKSLAIQGMSVARLNMSHFTHEEAAEVIRRIREVQLGISQHITIALDTQGPECRTVLDRKIRIKKTSLVKFFPRSTYTGSTSKEQCVGITLSAIPRVRIGNTLYLDDMKLDMIVVEVGDGFFVAEAKNSYVLENNKKIVFQDVELGTGFLQEKDMRDLEFGRRQQVDAIFLSLVQRPEDVLKVKSIIADRSVQVVAKIETAAALKNIYSILSASDGIMVARGDLCASVGLSHMFAAQKKVVGARRRNVSKPMIMATGMLESMVHARVPTRAEISDVGNAVVDGCTTVMLSAETAMGAQPNRAVQVLRRICMDAERLLGKRHKVIVRRLHEVECGKLIVKIVGDDREVIRKLMFKEGVYCAAFADE